MTDEDFIAALNLPGAFPQLGKPKAPQQPANDKESTDETE